MRDLKLFNFFAVFTLQSVASLGFEYFFLHEQQNYLGILGFTFLHVVVNSFTRSILTKICCVNDEDKGIQKVTSYRDS